MKSRYSLIPGSVRPGPASAKTNPFVGCICLVLGLLATFGSLVAAPSPAKSQDTAPPQGEGRPQGPGGEGRMPVFGKITAIHDGSLEITDPSGQTVTVKLTDKTEFRKDRQPAKRSDFKVGDIILVRGDENPDHSWTAQVIAARSMNGPGGRAGGGPGGGGRGEFAQTGTLGKDFVAGEVKSIDAPKLSVLRTDNVTQTIELNEDTSLRKGRDAITMADIQPGDHVLARGAMQNDTFVSKTVMIIGADQWKRMQEWNAQGNGQRRAPSTSPAPPGGGSDAQKPSEPQH
jgi:hypothetical protein